MGPEPPASTETGLAASRLPYPQLLVITDRRLARRPLPEVVAAAVEGGCRWIMLREKDMASAERLRLTQELLELARPAGATVSVNGDLAAASLAGAVHLPKGRPVAAAREALGTEALIGVSCHSLAEAVAAAADGADYVTLSPIFATASKPRYGPALGLPMLAEAGRRLAVPVVALGGIDEANLSGCIAAGAASVAVMGPVMRAEDPRAMVAKFVVALEKARR